MASVKIVLRTNYQKKDGSSPLAIRITKNRKTRYVFTGKYIFEKDWNAGTSQVRKSHPNSTRLNNYLLKKLSDVNNTILELDTKDENLSTKQLQDRVKRTGKNISFFQLAEERIAIKDREGVYSVSRPERSILNNIRKFTKNEDLLFQDITPSFLTKFKAYCTSSLKQKTRTVTNHLIFIRTLFNAALKGGIVEQKHYPFAGEFEKIRIGNGLKIGLSREEITQIENLSLEEDTTIWHTRNVWLFSFYFAGIRISDVLELTWKDFKDGRLFYVMHKNEKPISLKIPEKALAILDYYQPDKQSGKDYVFPFLKKANPKDPKDVFVKSRNASRLFNKYLKRIAEKCKIEKNLSNHIARHSFGNIAGDQIHPLMLQKLYRHTELKTTINYQANFIHKEADEALDKVLNF